MSIIESAIQWATGIARDNSHGYSQSVRWGPSYDCSSLVISAFKQAGLSLQSTYTGNMKQDFLAHGFELVHANFVTGDGLQRGDVLLNEVNHTALYLGDGILVHARSSEGTSDTRDNSGNEIREQMYYNYPWDCCLRYTGKETLDTIDAPSVDVPSVFSKCTVTLPELSYSDYGDAVAAMQSILKTRGEDIGYCGVDGDFGEDTENALKSYQTKHSLTVDGICGSETWTKLIGG